MSESDVADVKMTTWSSVRNTARGAGTALRRPQRVLEQHHRGAQTLISNASLSRVDSKISLPLKDSHEQFEMTTANAHHPKGRDEREIGHRFKAEFDKHRHSHDGKPLVERL